MDELLEEETNGTMSSSSTARRSRISSGSTDVNMSVFETRGIGNYDEAFQKAGFGLWQYFLLLQCGWANASDSIEIISISLIMPSVGNAFHVTHAKLSLLTIVLFVGMMIGGYLWGSLADIYGRKKVVSMSLTVNAVFSALSAFCTNYWLLLFLRLISGVGAGGSLPVVFSYFSEFQPVKHRGAMVSALATCWMAGNVMAAGLAWGVLPESHGFQIISPYGEPWRLYVILCAVPCLSSAFFFWFMPESPKYLHQRGRLTEALKVLKTVYKWNHRSSTTPPFKFRSLIGEVETQDADKKDFNDCDETEVLLHDEQTPNIQGIRCHAAHHSYPKSLMKDLWCGLKTFKSQLGLIYGRQYNRLYTSIALTIVYIFVAFGGYGMAMWTPVLMEKTERFGGSPCRGQEGNDSFLGSSNDTGDMYIDVFIGAASQLPGNALTVLFMDRYGAKFFTIFSCATSGLSVLGFWLVETRLQVVIMNGIFNAAATMMWNSLDVITTEMYPTSIRSTAMGHLTAVSRLGSIMGTTMFGLFMDLNCSVPILTVFAVFTISTLFSFKLPNTKNVVLD